MARFGRFRRKAPIRRRRLLSRRPKFGRFRKRPRRLPVRRSGGRMLYDPYWMNSRTSVGSNWKWSSYNNDRLAAAREAVALDRFRRGSAFGYRPQPETYYGYRPPVHGPWPSPVMSSVDDVYETPMPRRTKRRIEETQL